MKTQEESKVLICQFICLCCPVTTSSRLRLIRFISIISYGTCFVTLNSHDFSVLGTVKEYFRIRSVLCNKPLCASGENSRIVICENGSAYDWFQSSDNTTIRWREDDRLGFSALGHNFTLTAFEGNKRQFWYIYGHNITNRLDPNEVVDLRNSNCSNGADLQRFTYSSSAENQKWDFVYIN